MIPQENMSLEDMEGEYWIDAIGYDGQYQVSNLGRFKSLQREVNTRWGTPRMIYDKILKQTLRFTKNRNDGYIVNLEKTWYSSKIMFLSFYPEENFSKSDCVIHLNKIITDNRIVNLEKGTRKKSVGIGMLKSHRRIKATPKNLQKAKDFNLSKFSNRTDKTCLKCGFTGELELFLNGRLMCKKCKLIYDKHRRSVLPESYIRARLKACGQEVTNESIKRKRTEIELYRLRKKKKYES